MDAATDVEFVWSGVVAEQEMDSQERLELSLELPVRSQERL